MSRVFISYAREDAQIAERLYSDLKTQGLDPWIDSEDLLPGTRWRNAIKEAIRTSAYFIALMSSKSINKRGYVQKELRQALEVLEEVPHDEIFLIPARIEECRPAHPKLEELQWVDLFPSYNRALHQILTAITRADENRSDFEQGQVVTKIREPRSPARPDAASDIASLLRGFQASYLGRNQPPRSEREIQDIVWTMLASSYADLVREPMIGFSGKFYRPDFALPAERLLIEIKYLTKGRQVLQIADEIIADCAAYLQAQAGYDHLVVFVFNGGTSDLKEGEFMENLQGKIPSAVDIVVAQEELPARMASIEADSRERIQTAQPTATAPPSVRDANRTTELAQRRAAVATELATYATELSDCMSELKQRLGNNPFVSRETLEKALNPWKRKLIEYLDKNVSYQVAEAVCRLRRTSDNGPVGKHLKSSYAEHLSYLEELRMNIEQSTAIAVRAAPEPSGKMLPRFNSFIYGEVP